MGTHPILRGGEQCSDLFISPAAIHGPVPPPCGMLPCDWSVLPRRAAGGAGRGQAGPDAVALRVHVGNERCRIRVVGCW